MKKVGVFVFILFAVLIISFTLVHAQEAGLTNEQQNDLEKTQQAYDNTLGKVPITQEGKIDPAKLNLTKTQAEQRIDNINNWILIHAEWLKLAFGMVPEISWLFGFNILIWLFAFTYLIMNTKWVRKLIHTTSDSLARVFGILTFVTFIIVLKINYLISNILNPETWWGKLLLFVILIGIFVLLGFVAKSLAASAVKEEEDQAHTDREALHKLVEGIDNQ